MKLRNIGDALKQQLTFIGTIIALMWVLEIIDSLLLGQALNQLGILPRQLVGLRGILFMPLLHGDFSHIASNTIPFAVLGWLILARSRRDFFYVTLITMLVSGLGIWLLGHSRAVYIGASGVIFGYFGFLLLRGYFDRNLLSIVIAIGVAIGYGGLIWGVLPNDIPGISWEAHLLGFIGGILAARIIGQRDRAEAEQEALMEQIHIDP